MEQKARLILDSHENMAKYADEASVDGICFNFGYLPGSDHSLATKPESSKNAVIEGLRLLKKGGVMSLCIYSGGETGFEERDTLLAYLKSLDEKKYLVIVSAYYNRKNNFNTHLPFTNKSSINILLRRIIWQKTVVKLL